MGQDFILILSDELVSCPMVLLVADELALNGFEALTNLAKSETKITLIYSCYMCSNGFDLLFQNKF